MNNDANQINCFYRDNNVNYITIPDVDLLVSYFDSDRDGNLNYNEYDLDHQLYTI